MEQIISELKSQIDQAAHSGRVLIAIDGNCTAGKTTLAGKLAEIYDCNVFHMDDFFLRPQQRTPQRYAEAGGNVDYERFAAQVLEPLKTGQDFSYRPFDCKTLTLKDPIPVSPKAINIIEGTYSLHPHFGEPYRLKVFLSAPYPVQLERLQNRPAHLYRRFVEEWIPMENRYFEAFGIRQRCHLNY